MNSTKRVRLSPTHILIPYLNTLTSFSLVHAPLSQMVSSLHIFQLKCRINFFSSYEPPIPSSFIFKVQAKVKVKLIRDMPMQAMREGEAITPTYLQPENRR